MIESVISTSFLARAGLISVCFGFFFFKQKTAYEIYQCDWSSDVCSSDLDEAVEILERARLGNWHLDQQSRVEFLAGQIREQQGKLELAREHYELVLRHSEKRSSEVDDDARARLEALDELGVH